VDPAWWEAAKIYLHGLWKVQSDYDRALRARQSGVVEATDVEQRDVVETDVEQGNIEETDIRWRRVVETDVEQGNVEEMDIEQRDVKERIVGQGAASDGARIDVAQSDEEEIDGWSADFGMILEEVP
jgi:ATP-dependent Clp protease ATP-binding subunit ClpA